MIRVLFKIFTHFKADKFFTNQGLNMFPFLPYNQLHIEQLHRHNIGIDRILNQEERLIYTQDTRHMYQHIGNFLQLFLFQKHQCILQPVYLHISHLQERLQPREKRRQPENVYIKNDISSDLDSRFSDFCCNH